MTHELCHVFGLSHCNFYECAMNSSKFVSEVDEQPIFLCPVCLRKLQKFLKFKLSERYLKLRAALNAMQSCYMESISLTRADSFDEIGDEVLDSDAAGEKDVDIPEYCGLAEHEPARHICIEVTREKTDGYDIINVEYKQKGVPSTGSSQVHGCHFREAIGKLDDIISFLNRN